ncbi:hypothetical protein [Crocosphaera sp.]|nr:hypothetical protein [Crocosphaera sp.]
MSRYPKDWKAHRFAVPFGIAFSIKEAAGWRCAKCGIQLTG